MTDAEREERAIWKLEQGGYRIQRTPSGYLVTSDERADELDDLAALVAYVESVYDLVWIGRKVTSSA